MLADDVEGDGDGITSPSEVGVSFIVECMYHFILTEVITFTCTLDTMHTP